MMAWARARETRFYAFVVFLGCVALMGGGSRGDIQSLLLLRPLAILFCGYAGLVLGWNGVRRIGAPLWLLAALALVIALQLIPLPPSLWLALPQFSAAARIDSEIGLGDVWRPLALSPSRAWNSLFALAIPLAALLIYQVQDKVDRRRVLISLLFVGVASTVFALLQISGSPEGALYTYRVTNSGAAVGFFANRNHQAVFIGALILVAAWYFRSIDPREERAGLHSFLAAGAILLFVPALLLTGSRAGFLVGALALAMGFLHIRRAPLLKRRIAVGRREVSGQWLLGAGVVAIAAVFAAAAVSTRALTLDRLFAEEPITSMRAKLLPKLLQMVSDYFPFGSGYGSFEFAYQMVEPDELLGPKYLNQAHNDWLQWMIEGGLPAIVLLLAFLAWFGSRFLNALRRNRKMGDARPLVAGQVIILLGIASLFDYPLRVPIMMVFAAFACMELQEGSPRNGFTDS